MTDPATSRTAGPKLSCAHTRHTDAEFLTCLAADWNISVPELIAMFLALCLSHQEATAEAAPFGAPVPERVRRCEWCGRPLPSGTHHNRAYCPGTDCARLSRNLKQAKRQRQERRAARQRQATRALTSQARP